MKVLLFQTSSTQRVSVTHLDNGDWLISKEWRKVPENPWVQGKGVRIPKAYVKDLAQLLNSDDIPNVIADMGLKYLEETTF